MLEKGEIAYDINGSRYLDNNSCHTSLNNEKELIMSSPNEKAPSEVYILHFNQPYWKTGRGDCKHYVGYTTVGTENRIETHRKGRGSLLVNYAFNKLGIEFTVGMTERFINRFEARQRERQLKREGHLSRHCAVCNGKG